MMNPHFDPYQEAHELRQRLQRSMQENRELRERILDLERANQVLARRDLTSRGLIPPYPQNEKIQ